MCTVLPPPGVNPTAVNKYIKYGPLITEFNTKVTNRYRCDLLIIIPINL